MTISFCTPGAIDLQAAFTFGISAKENENPIGYFGTGLKYAIATLLRTGHKISLITGGDRHEFTRESYEHRGKSFELVCLDGKSLNFTTELGKNWEIWMAFRELHSNTLDEKGTTTDKPPHLCNNHHDATIIEVEGPGIETAFAERTKVFCSGVIVAENDKVKIRHGQSAFLYYRGVRAMTLQKPSMFTYDIQTKQTLTEDRTFAYSWSAEADLKMAIASIDDPDFLRTILSSAPKESFEFGINFEGAEPSHAFLEVAEESFRSEFLNPSARRLMKKHRTGHEEPEIELDVIQKKQLERAINFLTRIGFEVTRYPVKVCELHGPLAQAKNGTIYLTPQLFRMGTKYLALGVFEEFLHLSEGCLDETRKMQTILFETVLSMGEKILGEPL